MVRGSHDRMRCFVLADTLSNLSAFMIIDEAQEKFGFRASDYGMTPEEGARVAKWFARFDENANQRIEPRELMRLAKEMGQPLTEEGAATALKLLDKNGNGVIEVRYCLPGALRCTPPFCSDASLSGAGWPLCAVQRVRGVVGRRAQEDHSRWLMPRPDVA